MKPYILYILFLFQFSVYAQFTATDSITKFKFTLHKTTEVDGRQGVCVDKDNYYVSGSKELFKYSRDGKLLLKNSSPFKDIKMEINHFGDIDIYNGRIYSGIEYFKDGVGVNQCIGIYNTEKLELEKVIILDAATEQKEVSGIAIDAKHNLFWLTDWTDGNCVYKYDLETGNYLGKIIFNPAAKFQQGVLAIDNYLLVTSDDGDAETGESDNLYAIVKNGSSVKTQIPVCIKKFNDVKREGEIEGLTYDPYADELLVLFNRGARIIKGMPKGFYEGYEKEIHEIYHYKIKE